MSENFYEETIRRINQAQIELKVRLEQVSKLRVDCVILQLELLQLYKPQCLEILEMLRDVSALPPERPGDNGDNGDHGDNGGVESRNNEGSEVLRAANEDVPMKSMT
ncbi:uncharacterized protein LOC105183561 [Harpegnathos saltator]|uniref:uncharacterized protein LOC105183561 n=1 Tax=Harpegnathos saltator TaxID=610380 RepID=UPI00058F11D4|nr:uncharacterized protein LOC105183561 [Harpegnathos saltator]XP_025160435.1 uncharacterized protein LOC105183561 [Harpegnathos saltator]